jgi:2-keto-4-pentenoate hydratase/2-oxohepta-3-ene-1,7-dioic acid hydratase in catechol pathway
MRIARFSTRREIRFGIVEGDGIQTLAEDPFVTFGRDGEMAWDGPHYPHAECRLLAPCLPSKIVCLGVNYRPHASEMKSSLPAQPLIFLIGPVHAGDVIEIKIENIGTLRNPVASSD